MIRLIAALVAVVLVLVAPAAIVSALLAAGLQRDFAAQDATVRIPAGPLAFVTGRVGRLQLRVRGAVIDRLSVREFRADLRGVRLEMAQAWRGRLQIREVGSGEMTAIVDAEALQRHLAAAKGVQEARVALDDGGVTITGRVAALDATFGVDVRARLAIEDGSALVLQVEHLAVSGVALPAEIAALLTSEVNPLLRAPREPVPVRFSSVTVRDGVAVIAGEVIP